MSDNRLPWTEYEKALLQRLRTQNPTMLIVPFTALFNAENSQYRTHDAIRSRLKLIRAAERGPKVIMPYPLLELIPILETIRKTTETTQTIQSGDVSAFPHQCSLTLTGLIQIRLSKSTDATQCQISL
jgi:hypothetical protein